MSTEGIVFLVFFFLTLSSIFYVAGTAIKGQKLDQKFKKILIDEGQINGYIEYIQWMKDRNPWGGLVPASVARKNLIRESDSKKITEIAEQWIDNLREHQKRGLIFFILFISVLLIQTIMYNSNKVPKSSEYNTSEKQSSQQP